MQKREQVSKILVATQSGVKNAALKEVISGLNFYSGVEIESFDIQPEQNPPQPINTGRECALRRLELLKSQQEELAGSSTAVFIAIESGITDTGGEEGPQDVCNVVVSRGEVDFYSFSTPIPVPSNYYQMAKEEAEELDGGLSITVGEIIEKNVEGVDAKNWMKEEQFGGYDRLDQLKGVLLSALGKLVIEDRIGYYPDFPKEGVMFKDLSFAIADPECLKLIVSSLSN